MKWDVLKKIADDGSIQTSTNDDNGIVSVTFSINNALIQAQFSCGSGTRGLYAFSMFDASSLLTLLNLDENGNPLPEPAGDEDVNE